MTNKPIRELPPLDDFIPVDPQHEVPDRSGHFIIERHDAQGREINADVYIGWRRPAGPHSVRREPNTLYVQDIQVTEGHHLGAATLNLAIQHAQQAAEQSGQQLHEGRMQIINPRMVWVVEKLKDLGIIRDAFYLENGDTTPHRLPPTRGFENLPGLKAADEAVRYMDMQEAMRLGGAEAEQLGIICCKFTF